jgi:hypothetical protein
MWHCSHKDFRAQNFDRQLIISIEKMGIKVSPNFKTYWHHDDKVGQKYLFEAIDAPLVHLMSFTMQKKHCNGWNPQHFQRCLK